MSLMMSQSLKQQFEAVSKIAEYCEKLGEKLREKISFPLLFATAVGLINLKYSKTPYTALDHSAFIKAKKDGPEHVGYDVAIGAYEKFIAASNQNLGNVALFMRKSVRKSLVSQEEQAEGLSDLLAQRGLANIQKFVV